VEFSALEAQLTSLEQALQPYEKSAKNDINYAYVISGTDRPHWPRIQETMRALARIRLSLANLDIGSCPKKLRKIARIATRLESLDTRLEAYEDLYEGAVDRIADFRWYRHGELLEIAILVLLALEVAVTVWFKA
jgi:exonuclease VII small subunit